MVSEERVTSFELATTSLEGCDAIVPSDSDKRLKKTPNHCYTNCYTGKPQSLNADDLERIAAALTARLTADDCRRLCAMLAYHNTTQ